MASPSASASPAEIYDARFVPAVFGPFGERLCDALRIEPGHAVLDVACGTGALTVAAAARAGGEGRVVGVDANPEMLAVARRKAATVQWHEGTAESLPFDDASFDRVGSQFGMMFFDDPAVALRQMHRVLRPGGRLAVAVCDAVDRSPGYAVLTELLHRLFGASVADAFRAPFVLGDRGRLEEIAHDASVPATVQRLAGEVRFESIDDLVSTERACVWTLGGLLDDDQFARLRDAARESLAPFAEPDGSVRFAMPALCIVADA